MVSLPVPVICRTAATHAGIYTFKTQILSRETAHIVHRLTVDGGGRVVLVLGVLQHGPVGALGAVQHGADTPFGALLLTAQVQQRLEGDGPTYPVRYTRSAHSYYTTNTGFIESCNLQAQRLGVATFNSQPRTDWKANEKNQTPPQKSCAQCAYTFDDGTQRFMKNVLNFIGSVGKTQIL